MPASIFSTYSGGENRVTATILAVLRALSLDRTERLLGALLERSDFELIRFQNQPAKGSGGVPDAIIQSSCRILIETKIQTNAVKAAQIRRHLANLNTGDEVGRYLLVLTPDSKRPAVFDEIRDPSLIWSSFFALDQAINDLLQDPMEVVSEREAYLLRELQTMLESTQLLRVSSEVVIVAAQVALPEYLRYHAYVCQPNRTFRPVNQMGFYTAGQIFERLPKVQEEIDNVEFTPGKHKGRLGDLVKKMLVETDRRERQQFKVFFLSPPDSPETLVLEHPIANDLTSASGRPIAFTQGQRYVSLDRLKKARTTSDLVED